MATPRSPTESEIFGEARLEGGGEEDGDFLPDFGALRLGGGEEDGEDEAAFGEEDFEEEEEEPAPVEVKPKAALAPAKLRRQRKLRALLLSKYDAVWSQTQALGWTPLDEKEVEVAEAAARSSDWHVTWSDNSVGFERIMRMGRLQKVNHFPGMLELVRKAGTARNLNKMLKAVGADYKFFPKTFMLPADWTDLKKEFGDRTRGAKTFIVKPNAGCQGKGIILTRSLNDIDPNESHIVQRYMHKPHLLARVRFP